ncbi:MAG: hypothetical protein CR975_01310 [Gammaproteobacteria bacterium]|nr:MAG: hypothetical protein CR975_01310 [Gammaproteobacteria bacterium]
MTAPFLILLVAVIAYMTIVNMQKNAEANIQQYRSVAMSNAKGELHDKVTMVYDMVANEYALLSNNTVLEARYGKREKNVVEVANAVLRDLNAKVQADELSLLEAQNQAKAQIANMRYNDNSGYLWINDTSKPFPKMVMHPIMPSLNGTLLRDEKLNTPLDSNENLFTAAVALTEKEGAGFINYQWMKSSTADQAKQMQTKMSYVSLFEPWGWVVGSSGFNVDKVKNNGITAIKEKVSKLRYDNGEGYFFIISDKLPYPTTVMQPVAPKLNGMLMNQPKWNNIALNGTEHMFTAMVKVTRNPKGEGFVDYVWNKPTASGVTEQGVPKLSFEKAFKPLNWIIGSGIYIDNIDKAVEEKRIEIKSQVNRLIKTIIGAALLVLLVSLLVSYWFANNLSKALSELTKLSQKISLGKGLDEEIASTARDDEIGQLARAIERLQTSVKMMMIRMKR